MDFKRSGFVQRENALRWVAYGLILGILAVPQCCLGSDPLDSWTPFQSRTTNLLWSVIFGRHGFVAVGQQGTIITSPDGTNWTLRPSGTTNNLTSISEGDGLLVAVGLGSSNGFNRPIIITSPDANNWASRVCPFGLGGLSGVAYGGGRFVAVGGNGCCSMLLTSTDGMNWSGMITNYLDNSQLLGVVYGEGEFVATGMMSYNGFRQGGLYVTSQDGNMWNGFPVFGDNLYALRKIAFGSDTFVAIGNGDRRSVFFTLSSMIFPEPPNYLSGICYANGMFVAVGDTYDPVKATNDTAAIFVSSDARTWTPRESGTTNSLYAAAYGYDHFVAVGDHGAILVSGELPEGAPRLLRGPSSQSALAASDVSLSVTVAGTPPLHYQWLFNGLEIAGATNATLNLGSVSAASSGRYSVVIWNAVGSVTSAAASLAVVTDGANGNVPVQVLAPALPAREPGKSNLVVVTHGMQLKGPLSDVSWITNMCDAIRARVAEGWQVEPYAWLDWLTQAGNIPNLALDNARTIGSQVGEQIVDQSRLFPFSWHHIHLIAHSAGAGLIQAAADIIRKSEPNVAIHLTFLDPFLGFDRSGRSWYGTNADWSDNYFVQDWTGGFTEGRLANAYNVDVSWVDPARQRLPYGLGEVALSSHGYPHEFYLGSILESNSDCAAGYGFELSKEIEGSGWDNVSSHPSNNAPSVPCGQPGPLPNPFTIATSEVLLIEKAVHVLSGNANLVGSGGFALHAYIPPAVQGELEKQGGPTNNAGAASWLAVAVSITNAVNFVQFDEEFTGTNSAEGLLTVYWNTNLIGSVDERFAQPGLKFRRFPLPMKATNGLYTLSFRLDGFNNTSSSMTVTNLAFGFVGASQPITLSALLTNGTPVLEFKGASGCSFLVQSSTNLSDWAPTGLYFNTNGTVRFVDSEATNSSQHFYRAVQWP